MAQKFLCLKIMWQLVSLRGSKVGSITRSKEDKVENGFNQVADDAVQLIQQRLLDYACKAYTVGYDLKRAFPVVPAVQRLVQELDAMVTPIGQPRLMHLLGEKTASG